jgi:hypothetical protein
LLCNHIRTGFGKPSANCEPVWALDDCQWCTGLDSSLYSLGADLIENTLYNSSSITACVHVSPETCLVVNFLAKAVSSGSAILALSGHVTMYTHT